MFSGASGAKLSEEAAFCTETVSVAEGSVAEGCAAEGCAAVVSAEDLSGVEDDDEVGSDKEVSSAATQSIPRSGKAIWCDNFGCRISSTR